MHLLIFTVFELASQPQKLEVTSCQRVIMAFLIDGLKSFACMVQTKELCKRKRRVTFKLSIIHFKILSNRRFAGQEAV